MLGGAAHAKRRAFERPFQSAQDLAADAFARGRGRRRRQAELARRIVREIFLPEAPAACRLPAEAGAAGPGDSGPDLAETAPSAEDEDPFADEKGLFAKRKGRIRSIPFVQQIDAMDCGAASLAMVCRHFGRDVSLSLIRRLCHVSQDGTSLKAICHAATELGLAARSVKASLRNLPVMPLPAIVHWEGNHWM